jgi:hypothetical protein
MSRRLLLLTAFIIAALCCAAFIRLNPYPVVLELGVTRYQLSAGQALAITFLIGWAAGLVAGIGWINRLARERARLRQALRLAEADARTLRAIAPSHAS